VDQTILLLVVIVGAGAFMFWGQWRSRKRQQERLESMKAGDQIITIGGIYGELTEVDQEGGRARLKVAPDVEIQIGLRAVGSRIQPEEEAEE
jgi:preprotein translocase subunit YajC